MPAPPLAAKGSAGKGEDSPHLLDIDSDLASARRNLLPGYRHKRRMHPLRIDVNMILCKTFVFFITNHRGSEPLARRAASARIAGVPPVGDQ